MRTAQDLQLALFGDLLCHRQSVAVHVHPNFDTFDTLYEGYLY